MFFVPVAVSDVRDPGVTVLVRRTVTIGIAQRSRGTYTFDGQIARAEAGVPVTVAQAASGLEAGRSRLYGLLVNTTPATAQTISLDVGRSAGSTCVFSGAVSPGRSVPVTLARLVDGRLVAVADGRTAANGGYVLRVPVTRGTHFFPVVGATARSRVDGLVVAGGTGE